MIKREITLFIFVGVLSVAVDFISYTELISFEVLSVNKAKAVGFLMGTLFAYFANRFLTFGNTVQLPGTLWRFVCLYSITLGANIVINELALKLLIDLDIAIQIAFLIATGFSAFINFIGMKLYVFRPIST